MHARLRPRTPAPPRRPAASALRPGARRGRVRAAERGVLERFRVDDFDVTLIRPVERKWRGRAGGPWRRRDHLH